MFSSIRSRLTLWYVGVLALLIVAFAFVTYLLVSRNLDYTINKSLEEVGRSIETDLKKEEADIAAERLLPVKPAGEEGEEEDEETKREIEPDEAPLTIEAAIAEEINDLRSRDYGFLVLDQNGQQVATSIGDVSLHDKLIKLSTDAPFVDLPEENETIRVYSKPLELDGKPFRLLITRSLREQTDFLAGLRSIFYVVLPVALALAGLGGYFLARRSLAPVVVMSEQAASIGPSNLNERLAVVNERDELGSLANVFNTLLSRIEKSFNQQKQFMADASHELRTPIAIVRGESEVAISKESRTAEQYRESLSVVHDESLRLSKIVDDLFTLARADADQLKPHISLVYLDEILVECVRVISRLGEKRNIKLNFAIPAEMPLEADETLLHRLFINLLDNAIKYNHMGGTVSIYSETDGKNYRILVSDTGSGIAEDDRERIFERFYRADKARARNNSYGKSGVGLGLPIAAWIAEAHQGSVNLERSGPDGSTFAVVLPSLQTS